MKDMVVDVCPMGDKDAMRLEYDIYLREGYIGPNDRRVVLENLNYPEFVHFVARMAGKTVGSLRLVTDAMPRHGVFRLGSFRHFSIQKWATDLLRSADQRRVVEVGTMVIHPDHRGGEVYAQLFQKAFEYAILQRIHYALATIDEGFFNRLCNRGLPFKQMGRREFYMGSHTVPALIDVEYLAGMLLGGVHAAQTVSAHPAAAVRPALAS